MNLLLLYVLMFSPVQLIVLVSMHVPLIVQLPCFHGFLFLYLGFPHCCLSLCAFCPFFCGYYLAFLMLLCFFIPFFIMKSCAILPSVIKYLPFVIFCGSCICVFFCGWVSWLQIVFSANSIVLSSLKVVSRQGSLPSKVRHVY